jgi:hypothetical protein
MHADTPVIVLDGVGLVKFCANCQVEHPVAEFYRQWFRPGGLSRSCRASEMARVRMAKADARARIKARGKPDA